ncbi:MBL fold metallo-hydrolase, partial [Candidatus Bathyarchaeota archaeon]|nr:MBL fold metallo-hydrolase [Candidatus Bathyarchaeota archaeon]
VDLLSTSGRAEVKTFREWVKKAKRLPVAEHGFSMFVRISDGSGSHMVLFDAGISPKGVVTNAKRMGVNLSEVEVIVLSHGHYDHFGGLPAAVKIIKREDLPVIVHEDMFKIRGVEKADGTVREYPPFPDWDKIKPAKYIKIKGPYLISDGLALVTGEIPRKTSFEKGYLKHRVFVDGKWLPDPWIWDDRALIIKLRKGLVIISGCAHAGIINTIRYAQQLTGVEKVHAVFGGFHLAGKECEKRIEATVKELKKIKPDIVAPSHCTGWRGIYAIAKAMPKAFVWNSVGNLYQL